MLVVLSIITCLCYISGFVTMMSTLGHSTVLQEIASSISFLGGTVALAGVGIIHQLTKIKERLPAPNQTVITPPVEHS